MKIRLMQIEDYDAVYALWRSCSGMGLNDWDDSREGLGRFLDRNPDTCFAAEQDGKLTGVLLAGNDGRRGYLYHVAVAPGCRGQGIAAALLEEAVRALEKCGIRKVALVAFARNEAGNAFWTHMGFTMRTDLVYRDRALAEMTRIDT